MSFGSRVECWGSRSATVFDHKSRLPDRFVSCVAGQWSGALRGMCLVRQRVECASRLGGWCHCRSGRMCRICCCSRNWAIWTLKGNRAWATNFFRVCRIVAIKVPRDSLFDNNRLLHLPYRFKATGAVIISLQSMVTRNSIAYTRHSILTFVGSMLNRWEVVQQACHQVCLLLGLLEERVVQELLCGRSTHSNGVKRKR